MEINIGSKIEVSPIFPTPVGMLQVPNAEQLNPALEAAILKREAEDSGIRKSNIGGWHSAAGLTLWPEVIESGFIDVLREVCYFLIGRQAQSQRFKGNLQLTAWANVNRAGTFNARHSHPNALWSGVYYVRAGEYSGEADIRAGCLVLEDPRGSINMFEHPGKSDFGVSLRIPPTTGMLIVFPSWLYHSVHPFSSDTVRISIAFNAKLLDFEDLTQAQPDGVAAQRSD